MALLPSFRRFFEKDFGEKYQDLMKQLGQNLNTNFESLYNALNKNITLKENLKATVRDVTFKVDSDGIPTNTTSFKLDFTAQITSVLIGNIVNVDNTVGYPLSGVTVSWTQSENNILIDHITGLRPGQNYRITFLAQV